MDWKSEFLSLFTSNDVKDIGKALDIKREHMPEKLYRYRSLTDENINTYRLCEIVRGELYLSHPKELNDPFEVSSILGNTEPSSYMRDKEDFTELFHPIMEPEIFESIFTDAKWYDELLAYVAEKSVSPEKVGATKNALVNTVMSQFEEFNSAMTDMAQKMIRLACFSTTPNNLPMWHHYTNGHTGICLEYNTQDIRNVYQINRLFPVYYVDKMPDMTKLFLDKTQPAYRVMDYLAIHKLIDWSYENEWRLIYDAGSWYFDHKDVPKDYWAKGKSIQFIKPSKIIMGMKISKEHEGMIRENAKLANIPVIKAIQTEYGLKVD